MSLTIAQLSDHFQQRELGRSNERISYSTKKAYQGYLNKWVVPRWGDYLLPNIKAVEVELRLNHLEQVAGTRCKIGPGSSVQIERRPVATISMTVTRFNGYGKVPNAAVLPTFSLATKSNNCWRRWSRGSESWSCWMWQRDCDRANFSLSSGRTSISAINNSGSLARSCSRSRGGCKTEASQKPVPLHDHLISSLRSWNRRTPYRTPESWVFASPQNRGKKPYWGRQLLRHRIPPVANKLGITKRIGWHTFRRTYSTLLRATGATQGHAGTDAAFDDRRHSRHLHPGRDHREACCANRGGIAFRHQKKKRTAAEKPEASRVTEPGIGTGRVVDPVSGF